MWRVIPFEGHDAASNMAIDEALSEEVREGRSPPVIRFYTWNPSAISIGYFQKLYEEVDVEACKRSRVDIVRRWTGGGAVYHDSEGEITYSVIAPERMFPKNIIESYKVICYWVMDGLGNIGLEPEYHPINDILVSGRKISGNAQTRRRGILLQHGTILHDVDVDRMFSLLRVKDIKIKDKIISNVKERVTSVIQQNPGLKRNSCVDVMRSAFTRSKEHIVQPLSNAELARAEKLKEEKYGNPEWTEMR